MSALRSIQPVTYDEYLRIEEETGLRHEYVDGWLYAMAGATRRHNEIIRNLLRALDAPVLERDWRIYFSDVKFRVAEQRIYYPDVAVVCDPADRDPLEIARPCLVIEVLSPGTARTDLQEKREAYARVPSVGTYLVVEQDQRSVIEHRRTDADAGWSIAIHIDGSVAIPCLAAELSIDAIYRGLEMPRPDLPVSNQEGLP